MQTTAGLHRPLQCGTDQVIPFSSCLCDSFSFCNPQQCRCKQGSAWYSPRGVSTSSKLLALLIPCTHLPTTLMSFLDDFLCLKKSRLHGFPGKFIEEHLEIRTIAGKEKVKIKLIRDVLLQLVFFLSFLTPPYS